MSKPKMTKFNPPPVDLSDREAMAALAKRAMTSRLSFGNQTNPEDELRAVLRAAWEHVNELREAWRTGALSEHDGQGGTRSNRNAEVEVALRKLLNIN